MGNGLVPEKRVNKLGHVVTKHVRPEKTVPGESKFPIVLLSSSDRSVRISFMTDRLYKQYYSNPNVKHDTRVMESNKAKLRNALSKLPNVVLDRMDAMDRSADRMTTLLLLSRHDARSINDFISVSAFMRESLMTQDEVESCLAAIRACEELVPHGEDGEYPVERGEQALALNRVVWHMENSGADGIERLMDKACRSYPVIKEEKLRRLVVGDRREEVSKLIIERDMFDPDHIEDLIGSARHSALTEGNL